MARVYSSQNGVMRGRVGSTVYRKGQNATTASQYQPQVSNPKSDAQCIQRAAFNTAVQAQSALASIVDHSHKSLSGKRANLQRFVKDNTELLRAILIKDYKGENVPEVLLNLKGVPGIQPAPYRVSEGSLPFRPTIWVGGSDTEAGINIGGTIATGINSQETYAAVLRNLGIAPGDQLSLILIVSAGEIAGSYNPMGTRLYKNYQCHVLASRVTFKAQIPEGFSGELSTDNRWNPDLVVTEEGDMAIGDSTSASVLALTDGRMMAGEKIVAAVVIRSALDINGKFDYSTSSMIAARFDPFDMDPKFAAQSYGPGQSVRLGDQPFLDNPVQAGRVEAPTNALTLAATGVPNVVTSGLGIAIDVNATPAFSEMPTQVTLRLGREGATQTSFNLVGLSAGAPIAKGDLDDVLLADALVLGDDGSLSFSISCESGNAMVLGGTIVANGVKATF